MSGRFKTTKRVTVYPRTDKQDPVVLSLNPDVVLEELCTRLEALFETPEKVTTLYNARGARICDPEAIRDDEVLYLEKDACRQHAIERRVGSGCEAECPPPPLPEESRGMRSPPAQAVHAPHALSGCLWLYSGEWLTLNVGGKHFMTTRSTLVDQVPGTMLARMFSSPWHSKVDSNGAYLIDRSPTYFEPILNYLRHGQLVLDKGINPQGVLEEAKFFGIEPLIGQLEALVREDQVTPDSLPVCRRELVFKLMGTQSSQELRCQGVDFSKADLSKLDLRHVNFKYAVLKGADLSSANLSYCNFERADLSQAKLDGANLQGAKMVCVSLEGASMCTANFEDPAGCHANLEGANMKSVNLENSQMSGVNLRVANLKNANLQNCDLRGAVLAGADLENCNLSGCDLQEANLRGANLKGAAFELMLNPLHMAQTVR